MMSEDKPSEIDWKALFEAASRFKEISCWEWMWDSDLFGVQNPANNEIGYCCVMGRNREHFALAVYLGTEGLQKYEEIQSGQMDEYGPDLLHSQKCIMVSFEDRKSLQEKDFNVIKKLGLSFRGRNAWPLFRSYLPGFFPWHLTKPEADFLLLSLQQTIDVALRFKQEPDLFEPPRGKDDCYFVIVQKSIDGAIVWENQWLLPPELKKPEILQVPNVLAIIQETKNYSPKQTSWELDSFYSTVTVKDGEDRPYFPHQILFADHIKGLVLHFQLLKPSENLSIAVAEEFRKAVKSLKFFPKEILVSKEEIAVALMPIATALGIKLILAGELPEIERVRYSMFESFKKH